MSFSLTNIVNRFINVRNKVKDADGNWVDQTKPREKQYMASAVGVDISSGITIPVFETWGKKVIIDVLEYGTDTNAYASLHVVEGTDDRFTNQLFHETRRGGGRAQAVPPISAAGSSFFEVSRDDNDAKVWLKKTIVLPEGAKLSFSSTRDETGTITYKVYWREIEE